MARTKPQMAIHNYLALTLHGGKFVHKLDRREVEVLAIAKGYAMVRRKGCAPYVTMKRELTPVTK